MRSPRSRPWTTAHPSLPILPTSPARRSHDYVRNGTSSLFAALDLATGKIISSMHRRHRHQEFLKLIEAAVPAELEVHLICDSYGTHKTPAIKSWLLRHPRFHFHFTPTSSSWLNLVERWFAELTNRKLRRSGASQCGRAGGRYPSLDPGMERGPKAVRVDQDRGPDPGEPRWISDADQ